MGILALYKKNHVDKDDERLGLFKRMDEHHPIKKVLYPGSYAHITPAFIFPVVVFNDIYKKLDKFYKSNEVFEFICKKKEYRDIPDISYVMGDYRHRLPLHDHEFDLMISQYSGFISLYCKAYLKVGGMLLANDSHGDASLAKIDPDYKFIAVINKRNGKYAYSTNQLESYFIPKKDVNVTKSLLLGLQRGIGYVKSASNYIFERVA